MVIELGVLGAGQMAEAIVRGLLRSGLFAPGQILAADVAEARRELFAKELGVRAVAENAEVAREAKTLLLSVKPYHMVDVLRGVAAVMREDTLVISIAAGIKSASIEKALA